MEDRLTFPTKCHEMTLTNVECQTNSSSPNIERVKIRLQFKAVRRRGDFIEDFDIICK